MSETMGIEESSGRCGPGRAGAILVVDAAEKAVLKVTGRCSPDSRDDVRLAQSFLGIARRRFLLEDWEEAKLYGRLAVEYAERATQITGTADPTPGKLDPS